MAIATAQAPSSYLSRSPNPSGLADVLNIILDKGLVIDAYVRVSLVGIELLTIDARIVIASVDTYLRFAEAVNRLDLTQTGQQQTLPGLIEELQESGASKKTKGVLEGAKEKIFGDEDDDDGGDGSGRRTRQRSRASSGSRSGGGSKRSKSS
jgi:gas vesicle structural protein